jgi:hypothetical protein
MALSGSPLAVGAFAHPPQTRRNQTRPLHPCLLTGAFGCGAHASHSSASRGAWSAKQKHRRTSPFPTRTSHRGEHRRYIALEVAHQGAGWEVAPRIADTVLYFRRVLQSPVVTGSLAVPHQRGGDCTTSSLSFPSWRDLVPDIAATYR